MELRVLRLDDRAQLPTRAHAGDAGLDLHAVEDAVLAPGERASLRPGGALEVPRGHSGPGLIDAGYRGDIRVVLLNTDRRQAFEIHVGDRIAQLVIIAVEPAVAVEVASVETSERGAGGFGSSGY